MKKFLHLIIIAVLSCTALFSLSGCDSELAVVDDTPYVGVYYYSSYPYGYYYSYPRYRTWHYRPRPVVTPRPPKPHNPGGGHVTLPARPPKPNPGSGHVTPPRPGNPNPGNHGGAPHGNNNNPGGRR